MKKIKKMVFILMTVFAVTAGSTAELFASAGRNTEVDMAYCTMSDLNAAYGEDRVAGWSRFDPDSVDRAITDAAAEIDGYLLSGGYEVPLRGAPATIRKYCIDIASANLVLSAGVLDSDPGGKAVLEQAKIARHYLTKVAEGKFSIPGYSNTSGSAEVSRPQSGNVKALSGSKLDLRGY